MSGLNQICFDYDQNRSVYKFLRSLDLEFTDNNGDNCFNALDQWRGKTNDQSFVFKENESLTDYLKKVLDGYSDRVTYTENGLQKVSEREISHVAIAQNESGIIIGYQRDVKDTQNPFSFYKLVWLLPNGNIKQFALRDYSIIKPKPGSEEEKIFNQTTKLIGLIQKKAPDEQFISSAMAYLNLKGEPISNNPSNQNTQYTFLD